MIKTKTLAKTNGRKTLWENYDDPLSKKMNGMSATQIVRKYSVKKLAEMFSGTELLALAARYEVELEEKEKQLKKTKKR